MEKPKISEVIVVEGKYDKNTLRQVVDAIIIDTSGFGLFRDDEKLNMLRKIAAVRGLIILTDGDGAGFVIRNYLKGALTGGRVLHAYIPDIEGKEKRKNSMSAEGKLGVEGMSREVLLEALRTAGATFIDENGASGGGKNDSSDDGITVSPSAGNGHTGEITHTELFTLGLSGRPESKKLREKLVSRLGLPRRISSTGLYDYLRVTMTPDELAKMVDEIK